MKAVKDILLFQFPAASFQKSSQKIIPITIQQTVDFRIDKLTKISSELGAHSFTFQGDYLIPQVFLKFKHSIKTEKLTFDRRELRTLTFSLTYTELNHKSIISNKNELKKALALFDANWKDSMLIGLIDCLLKSWDFHEQNSLEHLERFIFDKISRYDGNRSSIRSFKDNIKYFNLKNGDLILGDFFAKTGKPIHDLIKFLELPESWITYPYFSKVLVTYYEKTKDRVISNLTALTEAIEKHNYSNTNKRLISKIIIQANQDQYAGIQDKVKDLAFKLIGDPNNNANWLPFTNASNEEIHEISLAKEILNQWITRQFINVFFNLCINDERRKQFWLKYVKNITSFKVYGPEFTKNLLKQDERISEFIDSRFESVISNRDVAAFILYIGEYMIIEFSNEGFACCAYKINSRNLPSLSKGLNSVEDLRNSSLPLAITSDSNYFSTSDEGRLLHSSNWEIKFNHWLRVKVLK